MELSIRPEPSGKNSIPAAKQPSVEKIAEKNVKIFNIIRLSLKLQSKFGSIGPPLQQLHIFRIRQGTAQGADVTVAMQCVHLAHMGKISRFP